MTVREFLASRASGEGAHPVTALVVPELLTAARALPRPSDGLRMGRVKYEHWVFALRVVLTVAMAVLVVAGAITSG